MNTLDRDTQPIDLTGYTSKPPPTVIQSGPYPGPPQRRSPIAKGVTATANNRIASSQNQAEYAVQRLLTKFSALSPPTAPPTTVVSGDGLNAPFVDPTTFVWSWVNQAGATVTTPRSRVLVFTKPNNPPADISFYLTALPAVPYTVTAAFSTILPILNFTSAGISIFDSGSTKSVNNLVYANTGLSPALGTAANRLNTPFSYNSNINTFSQIMTTNPQWLRVQDNGTNRAFLISCNGFDWTPLVITSSADFFTGGDRCGVIIQNSSSTTSASLMTLLSFEITTP